MLAKALYKARIWQHTECRADEHDYHRQCMAEEIVEDIEEAGDDIHLGECKGVCE